MSDTLDHPSPTAADSSAMDSEMLPAQDEQFLQRVVRRNACVLFLGAGFSSDATSPAGLPLPGGETLGNAFWQWLGYDKDHGAYDPRTSPLDKLFDIGRKKRGDKAVLALLKERLLVRQYPDWYRTVAYPYWFRVYTTNVDNLIEMVYDDTRAVALEVRNAIIHRYSERDQTLAKLQYIKLNGSIADSDDIELVTFGARQYGARAADYDPWYDHFVRDYATHATILVGSQMSEPLFWRALVSRQGRSGAATELRLRSFLVCPHISPVVLDSLADFNVVPIQATAADFFQYLHSVIGEYPAYEEILVHVNPQLAQYRDVLTGDKRDVEAIKVFLAAFSRVAVPEKPGGYRSLFLLGAAPTWDDIALGLDAQREVTAEGQQLIEASVSTGGKALTVITGHRGCGKSTLLMRVAVNLAAAGYLVFHAWGEDVPEPHVLGRAIERLGNRSILMIDDAEWLGGTLAAHVAELSKLKNAPALVVAMRANVLHRVEDAEIPHAQLWVGDLTDNDIDAVIDVLEREKRLGVMTDRSRSTIRAAFKEKAQKQLLVAMREVTTGKEFDKIISKEFHDIEDPELRVTYLCACLATADGASLTREQLVAVSELPPARLLSGIERDLRDMLFPVAGFNERVVARHQLIAETVVERAPRVELAAAYKRVLSVLAHDMDPKAKRGEARRWFRLYKRLINHDAIYHLFERNVEEARAIFDSLSALLSNDSHFWLQYGSLELQYGELNFASTYIATAESLDPDDWYIQNAKGHLLLAEGRVVGNLAEAVRLRRQGEEILEALIERYGDENGYPWHTLIAHTLSWLEVWQLDPIKLRQELEPLRVKARDACEAHPGDERLREIKRRVEHVYLSTAQEASRTPSRPA